LAVVTGGITANYPSAALILQVRCHACRWRRRWWPRDSLLRGAGRANAPC